MGGQNFRLRVFEFFGPLLIERKNSAAARAGPQRFSDKKNVALDFNLQEHNKRDIWLFNIESIIPISGRKWVEPDLEKYVG